MFAIGFAADRGAKARSLASLADGTVIPLVPTVSFRLAFNPKWRSAWAQKRAAFWPPVS